MNLNEADDALTQAVAMRDEAERIRARAEEQVAKAETRLYVAGTNLGYAQSHYDAMNTMVEQRERVLRELTIAHEGGYQP